MEYFVYFLDFLYILCFYLCFKNILNYKFCCLNTVYTVKGSKRLEIRKKRKKRKKNKEKRWLTSWLVFSQVFKCSFEGFL